jgi:hypothetical protein
MKTLVLLAASVLLAFGSPGLATSAKPTAGLADATLLIVRHAEKPAVGDGLTPKGEARARAYADYFQSLTVDGTPVRIDLLVATADSVRSRRPRLTLEPLSHALNLPIEQQFEDHEVKGLVDWLEQGAPNRTILIAWHHHEIPDLMSALGLDPTKILPGGQWPDSTYDWVIVVKYDHSGKIAPSSVRLVREDIPLS